MPRTPTGRRVGRPPKAYETLLARVPKEFAHEVHGYAKLHRSSVSDLIRDGLRWRLHGQSPQGTQVYDSNTATQQDVLAAVTELRHIADVLEHRTAITAHPAPASLAPLDPKEPIYDNNTAIGQEAADSQNTAAQDEQAATLSAALQDRVHTVIQETAPAFDATKHRLGKLCKSGHEWGTTGQSLRANNKAGYCLACNAALVSAQRQAKQPPSVVEQEQTKAALLAQLHRWQHDEGLGPQAIAERLNANQEPTFSGRGHWSRGTVSKLLVQQAHSQGLPATTTPASPVAARRTTRTR